VSGDEHHDAPLFYRQDTTRSFIVSDPSASATNPAVRIQELEQRLQQKEASLGKRFEELAQLTRMLEEERAQKTTLEQELDDLRQRVQSATDAEEATDVEEIAAPPGGDTLIIEPTEEERRKSLAHRDLVRQSDLFDGEWYLATYSDVRAIERYSQDPQDHYLLFGGFEGRNPCPEFDSAYYLKQYPDVAQAKMTPLVHYLLFGRDEGRRIAPLAEG
jgi:TolA-binding protein